MARKIANIDGIGNVLLVKRRGTKNLRLSIQPDGQVRVGLPAWAPYSAGIRFAASRSKWITDNLQLHKPPVLRHGQRIGKFHNLTFRSKPDAKRTYATLRTNTITVVSPFQPTDLIVQKAARKACEKALKKEADLLLDRRVQEISSRQGLRYKNMRVKRLKSRWGSCSQDGLITLNYYLIQLPWELIDYVIVHELAHTQHLDHSRDFWDLVESIIPGAKGHRKTIRNYRPVLLPS
ncbi:MAG TPA: SprT family zinc-dependent metalloprotease [Candidatus Babeliales bacterium]|nr:SprT family zinc-dependent metalloprotease [Candidatus Babeliales bacterium]